MADKIEALLLPALVFPNGYQQIFLTASIPCYLRLSSNSIERYLNAGARYDTIDPAHAFSYFTRAQNMIG